MLTIIACVWKAVLSLEIAHGFVQPILVFIVGRLEFLLTVCNTVRMLLAV